MTTETQLNDFSLTYQDVEQILGIKKRTIQDLVTNNELEKRLVRHENFSKAYFSKSQVEELAQKRGVRKGGAEDQLSGQTKAAMGSAVVAFDAFAKQLQQKDADLLKYVERAGKLEGELEQLKPQLVQALKEKDQYKHKVALLEPRLEALTQKLHKEEILELQAKVEKTKKGSNRSLLIAWGSVVVIIIALLLLITNDTAVANIREALPFLKPIH